MRLLILHPIPGLIKNSDTGNPKVNCNSKSLHAWQRNKIFNKLSIVSIWSSL